MTEKEFNEEFSDGEIVLYSNDFGVLEETSIVGSSWGLGCGVAVVKLSRGRGCFDCERVSKLINSNLMVKE